MRMIRTASGAAGVVLLLAGCSSGAGAASSGEAKQCATFDVGASNLPADITALSDGTTPPHAISDLANAVYNMSQASEALTGELNVDIADADNAVQGVEDALTNRVTGSGATDVDGAIATLRQAYTTMATKCAASGYELKHTLR